MDSIFEIVPASTIYDVNNVAVVTADIREQLNDYRALCQNDDRSYMDRLQAWQFVKAYTQILRDRKEWRKKKEETDDR